MQVTETSAAGLKREYRVVVPATDLEAQVNERLDDLKGRVQLRGFRPGKVPVAHLKRLYGKSAMAEVIEAAVREANHKIITDNGFKLAIEPKVVLPTEEGAVEGVIDGKSDLAYTVEMEIVPPITLADFKTIKLTRLTAEVTDDEIDQGFGRRSPSRTGRSSPRPKARQMATASRFRFEGSIDGTPFEGGTGEDVPLVIGAGQFIPGFEEHLVGPQSRRQQNLRRQVSRRLPGDRTCRQGRDLCRHGESGGGARRRSRSMTTSPRRSDWSRWRSSRTRSRSASRASTRVASRQKLKRALLDQLDERHKFEPPPSLVEQEFNNVWSQIEKDLKDQGRTFADEGTTEEKAREEYRAIAERRVRLGLVIAEIGERNNIKVTRRAVARRRDGTSAAISRAGAADLGLLPEEPQRTCRLARALVRGQGGRLPGRTGRGHGKAGFAGRVVQGRRGVGGRDSA